MTPSTHSAVFNSMRDARSIVEAETSTLVIHLDDRSTDFLKAIYEGKGYPVISGATTADSLKNAIRAHSRIFMLGHGSPSGLFANGMMIDDRFGPVLAEKQDGLYIWCNADAYAERNKLSGLVSGMFISEVAEARMFGISATQEEVNASNANFSKTVRHALDTGAAHSTVRQGYSSATCQITQFNSERLYVFANGSASPALHKTSAAHRNYDSFTPSSAPSTETSPNEEFAHVLSNSELDWLEDYIEKTALAVTRKQADAADAAEALGRVFEEFGLVDYSYPYHMLIRDLALLRPENAKEWAHELLDDLLVHKWSQYM